jgi:hypothetical protein
MLQFLRYGAFMQMMAPLAERFARIASVIGVLLATILKGG